MAIRENQIDLRYDVLKPPFRGHVLTALLEDRNLQHSATWTGSHSFETQEEFEELIWHDLTLSDEEKAFDPQTGGWKHQRTFAEMSAKFPNFPTFAEIEAEFAEYLSEYDSYSGKRERVYPKTQEQLDMLFHDIDSGLLGETAKTSSFYTTIKAVKDAHQ